MPALSRCILVELAHVHVKAGIALPLATVLLGQALLGFSCLPWHRLSSATYAFSQSRNFCSRCQLRQNPPAGSSAAPGSDVIKTIRDSKTDFSTMVYIINAGCDYQFWQVRRAQQATNASRIHCGTNVWPYR
jgi:hypothetical protein